jgi:Tfp pilus assembly protein PilZ
MLPALEVRDLDTCNYLHLHVRLGIEVFAMSSIEPCHDRLSLRKRAHVPCQAVAEDGFRLLGAQLLDVSPKGALVASNGTARLGEPVLLSLRVPGTRHWIDAEGRVSRVVRGTRTSDRGPAIGIELTRMDALDRAMLMGAIETLPPAVPARKLRRDYASAVRAISAG